MAKTKTIYKCSNCGTTSFKWQGKCNSCGEWDTLSEELVVSNKKKIALKSLNYETVTLNNIETEKEYRINTKIKEFDRVLGGGIVPGSLILIGGDPGIGKSTLMLQMCRDLIDYKPLYITGEESLKQIKFRSLRIKNIPDSLEILAETNFESIESAIKNSDNNVIILDSIQSIYSDLIESTAGSIVQVRECTSRLMNLAKKSNKAIIIIGHINKEGSIAGPKILEHIVDTVLQFEGDKTYSFRILRSIKNRFGSTNEIGIFEMTESGLNEVSNPSKIFLSERQEAESGIAIVASIEGSRAILLEVQALVTPTSFSVPQRTVTGFDLRRLQMIIAVLEKRIGAKFFKHDVFVNIAGGVQINDPSIDLGIAAALVSSLNDSAIAQKTAIIGEIGLTGEVRSVSQIEQRIREVAKLGFNKVVLPSNNYKSLHNKLDIKYQAVERISLALTMILND